MTSAADSDPIPSSPTVTAEGEAFSSRRLRYIEAPAPAPGQSVRVAPGVHWARIPLPMDLNHINVWLIETDGGCIVVDTGIAASIGKDAWEAIERSVFATLPLRAVFITHIHPDHVGLAAWLQERHGVPVLMSQRTHEMARIMLGGESTTRLDGIEQFFRSHGLSDTTQIQPMFRPERFARMASGIPRVERFIADSERLPWGESAWTALETNGHAEGHLCLSNPTLRVLISGDQVLPTISPNITYGVASRDPNPLGSYLASLRRLRTLAEDTLVLPSHGLPFRGLQVRVDDLIEHHEEHLERLVTACAEQPRTGVEILPLLFRRQLQGFHLFLAIGEALAHLEYLVHAGRLQRQEEGGLVRYAGARSG